jgi:hypothetical protein
MRQDDSTVRNAAMARLIERLRAKKDSGRRALAGASISSDGTPKMWGGQKSMVLVNPDGPAAADMLEKLTTLESSPADGDTGANPVDMLLYCPKCGIQHVDWPDERTPGWSNPPHRSHLCHGCGCIWRPADVPTNGVAAIATQGKADTWGESNSAAVALTPTETGEQGK